MRVKIFTRWWYFSWSATKATCSSFSRLQTHFSSTPRKLRGLNSLKRAPTCTCLICKTSPVHFQTGQSRGRPSSWRPKSPKLLPRKATSRSTLSRTQLELTWLIWPWQEKASQSRHSRTFSHSRRQLQRLLKSWHTTLTWLWIKCANSKHLPMWPFSTLMEGFATSSLEVP